MGTKKREIKKDTVLGELINKNLQLRKFEEEKANNRVLLEAMPKAEKDALLREEKLNRIL